MELKNYQIQVISDLERFFRAAYREAEYKFSIQHLME